MKINENKFKEFCIKNKVDKQNEDILRKLCNEIINNEIINNEMFVTTSIEDYNYLNKLSSTKEKVKFLRTKGYTQEKSAEIIGISTRQVQKIEKYFRDNNISFKR